MDEFYTLNPAGIVPAATVKQDYAGFCAQRGEPQFDYRTKVVRFLEDVLKLSRSHARYGSAWHGIHPRRDQSG